MKIDKNEVLRYLGYHGKPAGEDVLKSIDTCIAELSETSSPRSVSRTFDVILKPDAVTIGGVTIESRNLRRHIDGCREAVVFAATLGAQADLLLRRYSKIDMSRTVILQACAAEMVESYCDDCGLEIAEEAAKRGLFLRPRYSPGYGDFSIVHQKDILGMLDCQKRIGLTMTDSFMLAPSKSVTAVIGLTDQKQSCHIAKCMDCKAADCPFRKG
jgi:hypothetical protein